MSAGGWAVMLNGVVFTGACDVWDRPDCDDTGLSIIEFLSEPPDGLGLPDLRTEDLTFTQRDGVQHYADWYEPRIITLTGTFGPSTDECEDCTTTREQVREAINAWRRACCDTELVVFTDCDGEGVEGDPIAVQTLLRTNMVKNPSAETNTTFWSNGSSANFSFARSNTAPAPPQGTFYGRLTNTLAASVVASIIVGGDSAVGSGIPVTVGSTYTSSGYVRSAKAVNGTVTITWKNSAGSTISTTTGTATALSVGVWTRLDVTDTAPATAVSATLRFATASVAWSLNDTFDLDAVLFENQGELLDYFDGDTTDSDNPVVGGEKVVNAWAGTAHASQSYQQTSVYEENVDRSLVGPFGVVGRPRVARHKWLPRREKIADGLFRFDAVDQRLYVLDECGTPGYGKCVTLSPGVVTVAGSRCYPTCYTTGGRCYTVAAGDSLVPSQQVIVGGTEKVFPTITLYPNLNTPVVTNTTTGDYVAYNGTITDYPVVINTEEGTAFQNGVSVTHLLSGSIFMSMDPGTYSFAITQSGQYGDNVGTVDVCWRDTVVMA